MSDKVVHVGEAPAGDPCLRQKFDGSLACGLCKDASDHRFKIGAVLNSIDIAREAR